MAPNPSCNIYGNSANVHWRVLLWFRARITTLRSYITQMAAPTNEIIVLYVDFNKKNFNAILS